MNERVRVLFLAEIEVIKTTNNKNELNKPPHTEIVLNIKEIQYAKERERNRDRQKEYNVLLLGF